MEIQEREELSGRVGAIAVDQNWGGGGRGLRGEKIEGGLPQETDGFRGYYILS